MAQQFLTTEHERFLGRLRTFFGWFGSGLFLLGAARVGLEFFGVDVAATFNATLFTPATFLLGIAYAMVGYVSLYSLAATGALEPPALASIRYALLGLPLAGWITFLWGISAGIPYALFGLFWGVTASALCYWLWQQVVRLEFWRVFGEKLHRNRESNPIIYLVGALGVVILLAIGLIFSVLTYRIELPPSEVDSGELLYITTFDGFNDEWDLPRGRQAAEVVDGELVLTESSGQLQSVFYARLDSRRFGDFDLRVQTHQLSGDSDNTYGVIFRWRDFDNYYLFEISGNGYYQLRKIKEGQAEKVSTWRESEIVHQGQTPNQVRIVAKGDQFTFYINEQLAQLCLKGENAFSTIHPFTGECLSGPWEDHYVDEDFPQGKLGLAAGTDENTDLTQAVVIGFDNVVVVGP